MREPVYVLWDVCGNICGMCVWWNMCVENVCGECGNVMFLCDLLYAPRGEKRRTTTATVVCVLLCVVGIIIKL